jgi:hypothetical protein
MYIFCVITYVLIVGVLSFMLSFDVIIFTVSKCYHFYVIIFSSTYFVLSFMLSFIVIIPPLFSFSWKRDTLIVFPHGLGYHFLENFKHLSIGTYVQDCQF